MATSLIRSRAAITGVKDRFTWNEIKVHGADHHARDEP